MRCWKANQFCEAQNFFCLSNRTNENQWFSTFPFKEEKKIEQGDGKKEIALTNSLAGAISFFPLSDKTTLLRRVFVGCKILASKLSAKNFDQQSTSSPLGAKRCLVRLNLFSRS